MLTFYQIFAFYLILGLEGSAIIGHYPAMEPETFQSLWIFQSHPAAHIQMARICLLLLIAAQFFGIILTWLYKKDVETRFLKSTQNIALLRKLRSRFLISMIFFLVGILLCGFNLVMGASVVAGNIQNHALISLSILLLTAVALIISGWGMESVYRAREAIDRELGTLPKPEKFIWDHHAKMYSFSLKLFFLGLNVWWPYLVLRYALGLDLNALYFLPVHLAGVLPYSYLKRKHKFKRTIHPEFKGTIKKREKYISSSNKEMGSEALQT